jgi:hypothetical protein
MGEGRGKRGDKQKEGKKRDLEELVSTCGMFMENQCTYNFRVACGFHVEGMLQRGGRGQT